MNEDTSRNDRTLHPGSSALKISAFHCSSHTVSLKSLSVAFQSRPHWNDFELSGIQPERQRYCHIVGRISDAIT